MKHFLIICGLVLSLGLCSSSIYALDLVFDKSNKIIGQPNKTITPACDLDFESFFDNRETSSKYVIPQTIYGSRISPSIGLNIKDLVHLDEHKIMIGVNYAHYMGEEDRENSWTPILYYQFKHKNYLMALGASPYHLLAEPLPGYLMSDSLSYVYNTIQGALFQYEKDKNYATFICDWRGKPSTTQSEQFRLIGMGRKQWELFGLGANFQLNHKANFSLPTPKQGVCDDILINPYVLFDAHTKTSFNTLYLKLGYIYEIERERITNTTYNINAVDVEVNMEYRCFQWRNQFYAGGNLFPLYSSYGINLNQGSPYYQHDWYDRMDMTVHLLKRKFVTCYFTWSLHFYEGDVDHQQRLILNFTL